MRTPICGVLLLDPSHPSPLELVKSSAAHLVRGAGILLCGAGGTSAVTPERVRPADLQDIQPGRTRTEMSASHMRARGQERPRHTEMRAPRVKE
jgi:hypothetical protein